MKFAEHLSAHLTPEWRKQYIEYEALKEILYKALDDFEDLPVVDAVTVCKHFDECDTVFFAMCQAELYKINNFYAEKLAEAKRKFAALKDEFDRHFLAGRRAPFTSVYLNSPAAVVDNGHDQDGSEYRTARGTPEYSHSPVRRIDDMDMLRRRRNTFRLKKGEKRFDHTSRQVGQNEETPRLKTYDLKLALSEFYLSLVLLQNYQSLNFTGFRKILKKHDKLFQRSNGLDWYRDTVSEEPFHMDDSVDAMIVEVEETFTRLEGGDRQKAMKRLRVPPLAAQASGKSVFRFGLFLGIFLSEVLCIILVAVFTKVPQFSYPAFRLFRGSFLVIYYICMVGVNVYGWRSCGVNHVLIFEIDPRSHLNQFQLMELGMLFADFWGGAVLLYQFSDSIHSPGYVAPFVLFTTMLIFLFLPFHIFQFKSRLWLLKILFRIIRAPLARVRFPDFFLADQWNSLSFILPDLAYFLCFFINFIDNDMMVKSILRNSTLPPPGVSPLFAPKAGFCDGMMWGLQPILKALPAWWRFLQCLRRYRDLTIKSPVPHLMNAGKYSTTLIAIACSAMSSINRHTAFYALMILSKLCSSVCTTTWDLVMDWGLLDRSSKENLFLRDELVYRFRAYYYVAIVEDVIIRFAWILPIVFAHFKVVDVEIITTVVMFAEVSRRIIWNFFRLENEHLNNCGNFRAVRDIGITPIRKEAPPAPTTQEGDKVFNVFTHFLTLNHNNNNNNVHNSENNINPRGCFDPNQNPAADLPGLVGAAAADAALPPTLAEYAAILRQSNRKSLWNHLRENYFQARKEKRRRLDLDLIAGMEEALRAAKKDVEAKSGPAVLPPRGASPTEDPLEVQAALCENAQQLSPQLVASHKFQTTPSVKPEPPQPPFNPSLLTVEEGRQHWHQNSVRVGWSKNAPSHLIVVDDRRRKVCAKAATPSSHVSRTQQSVLAENLVSAPPMPWHPAGDLSASCANDPCVPLPNLIQENGTHSLDLATSPQMPHLRNEDSPDDTILPLRTRHLANQLRELLSTFHRERLVEPSLDSQTATLKSSPAPISSEESRPKQCRSEIAPEHGMVPSHVAKYGRWKKRAKAPNPKDRATSNGGGKDRFRGGFSRPKSVSGTGSSAVDSGSMGHHTSMEAGSTSAPDDAQTAEIRGPRNRQTRAQPPPSEYSSKFSVESVEYTDEVERF